MYTVKHAAELTGVPAATLRVWERRYGVVSPARSDGGYRLYDERSLRRLRAMADLVAAGWSARQAAGRVLVDDPEAAVAELVKAPAPAQATIGDTDALVRVGQDFDATALDRALDEAFALGSFERVVDGWLMPALGRLGSAWRDGRVSVAGEHFVSATIQRRLTAIFEAAGRNPGAPRVVVGLARASRHELGVLAFAGAARRAGLDVMYVAGDLPAEEWTPLVTDQQPDAVVIGVPTADDVIAVRETVAAIAAARPQTRLYVGGAHQHRVDRAKPLGHAIGPAAESLARTLREGPARRRLTPEPQGLTDRR